VGGPADKQNEGSTPRRAERTAAARPRAKRADIGFGGLADIVGLHIGIANNAILQNFRKSFERLQLTQKQTSLLWLIAENPGLSQVDFGRLFKIDRATMLGITNALSRRGLIERRPAPDHGRRIGLHLTAAGKSLLVEAKATVATHEDWVKGRFTPAEIETIIALMSRFQE
jgi:DNA-binding MarR family transcriptional regulator